MLTISDEGRQRAARIAKTFGLPLSHCLESQARLEGIEDMKAKELAQQAATGKQMDVWIRQQAGYGPAADAQPEGDQAPPKRADANAGSGSRSAGVGTSKPDMNQAIRDAWLGRGPKSWR